jgi:hypothetical protein
MNGYCQLMLTGIGFVFEVTCRLAFPIVPKHSGLA